MSSAPTEAVNKAPIEARSRPRLFISRIGARVALAHACAVIVAFALAGYVAQVSLTHISQQAMRDRISGEAAALLDELQSKGAARLPHTVAKRQRLWRGFDYRLEDAGGDLLAGSLPKAADGWSVVSRPGAAGKPTQRFLAHSEQLPGGDKLMVAQNLNVEAGQTQAIAQTLAACGALGVLLCIALSYVASRGVWRRVAAVAEVARAVSEGDLRVRAHTRSRPPQDDIDQLEASFNVMLDRIEVLIRQVRQVSTDIAHDMRTPLTRHRQRLERLKLSAKDNPVLLREAQGLDNDVAEILRTFDALLQLSEIEVGEAARIGLEDLSEVATRVTEAYRPDIEESGRTLILRTEPAQLVIDEALVAQAIANLLENALRHTPRGSTILVAVSAKGDGAELVVQDDGPGVPYADREAVLRPFVRLEPSRQTPGSGLGLSIVAAIAQRHGASVVLEDATPGFRVRLGFPQALVRRPTPERIAAE